MLPARATGRLLRPLQSAPSPSFGSGDPGHGVVSDLPIEILSIAVCREGEAGLQQRVFLRVGTVGKPPPSRARSGWEGERMRTLDKLFLGFWVLQ